MKCSIQRVVNLKVLESIISVLLLSTSTYFIIEMICEYLEENTNFSVTERTISPKDLPTLTLCLESTRTTWETGSAKRYGPDFTIQTLANFSDPMDTNPSMLNLREGHNEYDILGQRREILLQQLVVHQFQPHLLRTCISMKFGIQDSSLAFRHTYDGIIYSLGLFTVTLSQNTTANVTGARANLFTTSHRNSYGITLAQWYDGKVRPSRLTKGGFHTIQIARMIRYEHLKHKCSSTSFYECLGKNLKTHNECPINDLPCSPVSVPNQELPICPKNISCNRWTALKSSVHRCMGQIPCFTEEYVTQESNEWSSTDPSTAKNLINSLYGWTKQNLSEEILSGQYIFWLEFWKERSSNGRYMNSVQKYVHKEYLSWTGTSMVGNIGGQLGLWLGFSFTGCIAGALNLIPKIWDCATNN